MALVIEQRRKWELRVITKGGSKLSGKGGQFSTGINNLPGTSISTGAGKIG